MQKWRAPLISRPFSTHSTLLEVTSRNVFPVEKTGNPIWTALSAFLIILSTATAVFATTPAQISAELLNEVARNPEEIDGAEWCNIQAIRQEQWLCSVYDTFGVSPLWVNSNGPTDQGKRITSALQSVTPHGFNPDDYGVPKIEALRASRTAADLARLDMEITIGLLEYIHDMREGRFAPKFKDPKLFDQAGGNSVFSPVEALSEVLSSSDITLFLENLAPGHRHYRELMRALKYYRSIAENGGWPEFPSGETLRPGATDARIPTLHDILTKTGDLTESMDSSRQIYGTELVEAVKRFQGRHGLENDGIIGKNTTDSLIVPVEKRIQQILINMERWRWIEHELGSRYVLVDIAGFNLQGVVDDIPQLEMRVIVGKRHHATPVFSDTIKYIEFNPFWNITSSIARNEILPELREDRNYLGSNHIRLFSNWQSDGEELDPETINWNEVSRRQISRYKLRQEPGPWNALGVVKFVFPNKYSVYLHDTPGQELFKEKNRAFSHGCIRLNKPRKLAEFLLAFNNSGWTEETINQVIEEKKRRIVKLHEPIPIHLVYQTAWVNKDGTLHFSRDLYGRDTKLTEALFGKE